VDRPLTVGAPVARAELLLILLLALSFRVVMIVSYPAIHGSDSVLRLARSDQLVIGHWLPLPQAVVGLTRALAPDPFWTRAAFAFLGALAPVALAVVVAATAGGPAGRAAGVLLSLHPFVAYYSTVPYQEVVMLPLLLAGALALLRGREAPASLSIGLACLCRYEAWIAAALAGAARWRKPARAVLLFGWAPLAWAAAWGGLAPPGSYILDLDPAAGRLRRLAFLLGKLREYAGDTVLVLAALGAVVAWRRRPVGWTWAASFLTLFFAALAAVGHEFPPGSGLVSERAAHLPAVAICALAGLALGAAWGSVSGRGAGLARLALCGLVAWMCVGWAHQGEGLLAAANRDPSLRLALAVARLANGQLSATGRLAIAGPPVPEEAVRDYLRKVERSGGDMERARAIALETHVPDAYRIRAHLARPPRAVLLAGDGPADLIAVFDDAPDAERWRSGALVARFVEGGRGVTVYRP
jgi:phosphatidylglycerophosphate synthase